MSFEYHIKSYIFISFLYVRKFKSPVGLLRTEFRSHLVSLLGLPPLAPSPRPLLRVEPVQPDPSHLTVHLQQEERLLEAAQRGGRKPGQDIRQVLATVHHYGGKFHLW